MAATFTTTLGSSGAARTILSYYVNEDQVDFDALFRNEQRRSNALDDDIGFRQSNLVFDTDSAVRDLALRQDVGFSLGAHFVETGFEVHRLETIQRWMIPGRPQPERRQRLQRPGRGGPARRARLHRDLDPGGGLAAGPLPRSAPA